MLELPEAHSLALQIRAALAGKVIAAAAANESPHRFAWYTGDPAAYGARMSGACLTGAQAVGGHLEILTDRGSLVLSDGASPRLWQPGEALPAKRQLLVRFGDGFALTCSVQMYGGLLWCEPGTNGNAYYQAAAAAPDPLSAAFDEAYFLSLRAGSDALSAKAFLATNQRIPGLGNGVLQDILFFAGLHPRLRMGGVTQEEYAGLFRCVKDTLARMADLGGRDTEKDLYGKAGGYRTVLSKNTLGTPCPRCGTALEKAAYLGGAVYYCPTCQRKG